MPSLVLDGDKRRPCLPSLAWSSAWSGASGFPTLAMDAGWFTFFEFQVAAPGGAVVLTLSLLPTSGEMGSSKRSACGRRERLVRQLKAYRALAYHTDRRLSVVKGRHCVWRMSGSVGGAHTTRRVACQWSKFAPSQRCYVASCQLP